MKYIEEKRITSYDELVNIIKGKTDFCENLRDDFIFRGLSHDTYDLIPSALRDNKLDDFVDEDFKINLTLKYEDTSELNFRDKQEKYDDLKSFTVNKYLDVLPYDEKQDFAWSLDEFQFKKELNALMNFLNYADKVGLKLPINQKIRKSLEPNIGKTFDHESSWPIPDYYELISLAQHYGVPTRALDWSYDYKVSLYFAVKNILDEDYFSCKKPKNGVLWAFNYKDFRIGLINKEEKLIFDYYRPEYNSNPNLNAQKGLFTFVIDDLGSITRKPLDVYIEEVLNNYSSRKLLKDNKIAFYKFIIPEDIKSEILKELYDEGYSEEYLFPGYAGVTKAIENRVKLDRLIKNHDFGK